LGKNNIEIIAITKDLDNMFFRHIRHIATHLRECDYNELKSVSGKNPCDEVIKSANISDMKWIVFEEININLTEKAFRSLFVPLIIFGVVKHPEKENVGIPWMVAASDIKRISSFVMRKSRGYINLMAEKYKHLFNYVDSRNKDSIIWIKKMGFKFGETRLFGEEKVPFHKFYMGAI
jgi:hypothetical protein